MRGPAATATVLVLCEIEREGVKILSATRLGALLMGWLVTVGTVNGVWALLMGWEVGRVCASHSVVLECQAVGALEGRGDAY